MGRYINVRSKKDSEAYTQYVLYQIVWIPFHYGANTIRLRLQTLLTTRFVITRANMCCYGILPRKFPLFRFYISLVVGLYWWSGTSGWLIRLDSRHCRVPYKLKNPQKTIICSYFLMINEIHLILALSMNQFSPKIFSNYKRIVIRDRSKKESTVYVVSFDVVFL